MFQHAILNEVKKIPALVHILVRDPGDRLIATDSALKEAEEVSAELGRMGESDNPRMETPF